MTKSPILVSLILLAFVSAPAQSEPPRETVILLHGLARSNRSMAGLEVAFENAGFAVYSLGYPSTTKSVEELADEFLAPAVRACEEEKPAKIHFVTHSLGAIVLRQYLSERAVPSLGRIVMLGPPNQGSEVVDRLKDYSLFQWINGPAGAQLGTDSNSLPRRLPAPDADVGIIAGTRSINLFLSALIPGTDDGKVSPERTKLAGMRDFITVPVSHPFLMRDPRVIRMSVSFIRDGRFETNATPTAGAPGP